MSSATPVWAETPSFDPANGLLKVPELLIEDHLYTDVEVGFDPDNHYRLLTYLPPVLLTDDDDQKSVQLKPGQVLEIKLRANATTGFQWEFDDTSIAIVQRLGGHVYVVDPPPANSSLHIVGRGGYDTWKFKAVKSGTALLKLMYRQGWEPANEGKLFQVNLTVL